MTVAFSSAGKPIYASRDGKIVPVSYEAKFIEAGAPLIQAVRDESNGRIGKGDVHQSFGFSAHVAREGMVVVEGSPYFVAISNSVPEGSGHREYGKAYPLVATGQRVSSVIPRLSQDLGLFRPRLLLAGTNFDQPVVDLIGPDKQVVGRIQWQASRPGGRLLINAAPPLIFLISVALLALLLGMARVRRLFVALAENEIAIEVSRGEAQEANLAKSRFLANMSHELRTPLNGIIAMSEMLHQQQVDRRSREMTGTVIASGRILERVLNDVLDVSKIESSQFDFEQAAFGMAALLRDVTALHRATAEAKGLTLDLNIRSGAEGTYVGDHVRVSQVLSNLLSNAVKFTDRGGITLSVRPRPRGVRVVVTDSGTGFDRATASRLFKRFEQGDSSISRRHGGTGLGLWISRALVLAMGGKIRVRSIVGRGSLFSVYLPLEPFEVLPSLSSSSMSLQTEGTYDDEDGAPLRVLVAEDHPVNQRVITMILDTIGAQVTLVENGALAVEAFKDHDFDIILMDTQMPIMDGLTATQKIRALEADSGAVRTPVIAVTANAMAADQEASLWAGSDLHLSKPVRPTELLAAMSAVMGQ